MIELVFNNLSFVKVGGSDVNMADQLLDILNEIIDSIASTSTKLMKLKASNMYLRNDKLISNLCRVI